MAEPKEDALPRHSLEERRALGQRLATARKNAGFTLESAAQALRNKNHAIGKGAIGAWEVGRNVPDAIWIKRLARLYGCGLEAVVLDDGSGAESWPLGNKITPAVWEKLDPFVKGRMLGASEQILRDHREESGKSPDSLHAAQKSAQQ